MSEIGTTSDAAGGAGAGEAAPDAGDCARASGSAAGAEGAAPPGQRVPGSFVPGGRARRAASLDGLMAAAQGGDSSAYRTLLDLVSSHLRGLVWVRAPYLTPEDVEDLVQDILMSLHLARDTWDPSRPFRPWLACIARNRMADHARRFGRRVVIDLQISDIDETFCDPATNNHAQKVVDFLAVKDALRALPPSEQAAVRMLRLQQMTLAEASEHSGTSVAALKVAMHRATGRLRGLLSDEHRDGDKTTD